MSEEVDSLSIALFKLADQEGCDATYSLSQLRDKIGLQLSHGRVDYLLKRLVQARKIEEVIKPIRMVERGRLKSIDPFGKQETSEYRISLDYYDELYASASTKEGVRGGEAWSPLEIEGFEFVADQCDEFAEAIAAENGFVAKHPLDAEYVAETATGVARSLRNTQGHIIKVRLQQLERALKRILDIFDTSTRIGGMAKALFTVISGLFGG